MTKTEKIAAENAEHDIPAPEDMKAFASKLEAYRMEGELDLAGMVAHNTADVDPGYRLREAGAADWN